MGTPLAAEEFFREIFELAFRNSDETNLAVVSQISDLSSSKIIESLGLYAYGCDIMVTSLSNGVEIEDNPFEWTINGNFDWHMLNPGLLVYNYKSRSVVFEAFWLPIFLRFCGRNYCVMSHDSYFVMFKNVQRIQ
ncbi:Hypothetical predicted protein [Olea europaea subsp. europaea]|uniref:Uncharacterized protein n=1 Tax=Olea europaea subsp. europaea TaxID=158383 RepID=A0A8S0TJC1_OLEEU|nr:Hypothetical predicted protein [Olea europaea subsp. europaea]